MADGDKKRRLLPAPGLIAAAALAGLLAGAAAVYVTGGGSGNVPASPARQAVIPESDPAEAAACAGKAQRAASIGAAATGEVAALTAADPPRRLSGLAFNAPDGSPMTLGALSGKVLLVNLWATWCAPCRAEMPALDRLQQAMGGESFEVVAVNVDTGGDEKPKKFLAETGVSALAYYRDNTLGLFNELKRRGLALGLPVTLLVDADGCLLAQMNGPAEWASEDARRVIAMVSRGEQAE